MKSLGTNQPGELYMEQTDRGEALIRTRDRRLVRRLLSWAGGHVTLWNEYFVEATGQLIHVELHFPMRMWTRVAKAAGLIPCAKVTPAQRRARRANATKARATLRERRKAPAGESR